MKTDKSSENTGITPSKKKLKQARLPFVHISDVSSTPTDQPARKRKLSVSDCETVSKIGKITDENNVVEELVVISDDDSKDGQTIQKDEKKLNPFVKLVDNAWKKKLHRKSSKKKQTNKKKQSSANFVNENDDSVNENKDKKNEFETMDVDEPSQSKKNEINEKDTENYTNIEKDLEQEESRETPTKRTSVTVDSVDNKTDDVVLENSSDVIILKSEDTVDDFKENHTEVPKIKNADSDNEINKENKAQLSDIVINDVETPIKINEETTKKCTGNKCMTEEKNDLNSSSSSSKLDETICSNMSTQQTTTNNIANESLNESFSGSNSLTPKQLQKKMESIKKKEEREKERQEREKKRQQEKEEKTRQKQEKEEQRKREREEKEDAKRREKEEKEEQKRKEKEEKERQKELEKKLKEEKEEQKRKEREEKEELRKKEKEAKEEEKRKKQEALEQEKQEQELKKKKAAEAFVNFFVPKQKIEKDQTTVGSGSKNNVLSSFTIKVDMRLAPTVRVNLTIEQMQELDKLLTEQNESQNSLYLKSLKEGTIKPKSSGKTWPLSDKDDDDVVIVEDELPPIDGAGEIVTCDSLPREKLRPKLLSFHENMRPPYWGTWRKKSPFVKPRRPFGRDKQQLDYDVDSDEEWEEEQEGESIDGSMAGSDDEQGPDEYEVDNEVFVPHGYLSDEEATMDEDDVLSLSPETQKARLKYLEDEFESEMKKPTEKLKPRLYGLIWETSEGAKPKKCVDALWNYFGKLSMILNDPTVLLEPSNEPEEVEKKKVKKKKTVIEGGEQQNSKSEKMKKPENKENKKVKTEVKKNTLEVKRSQPDINSFLTKLKSP